MREPNDEQAPTTIDMTLEGAFAPPPGATFPGATFPGATFPGATFPGAGGAMLTGWPALFVLAVFGVGAAVVLFWLTTVVVPLVLICGLVAYAAARFQMWRARRPAGR